MYIYIYICSVKRPWSEAGRFRFIRLPDRTHALRTLAADLLPTLSLQCQLTVRTQDSSPLLLLHATVPCNAPSASLRVRYAHVFRSQKCCKTRSECSFATMLQHQTSYITSVNNYNMCIHIFISLSLSIYIYILRERERCIYIYIYVCIHVFICVYIYICTRAHHIILYYIILYYRVSYYYMLYYSRTNRGDRYRGRPDGLHAGHVRGAVTNNKYK